MNILTFVNKKIYVTGDLHGKFDKLLYYLKCGNIANAVVIIAGDIGLGFESKSYYTRLYKKTLSGYLEDNDVTIVCLRGNHDDPNFFHGKKRLSYPKLISVPDYSVLMFYDDDKKNILRHAILCIGGATSIDRTHRMFYDYEMMEKWGSKRRTYWEDEHPFYDEKTLDEIRGLRVDIIITHTAPSFAYPNTKDKIGYWLLIDPSLDRDLSTERSIMDNIYNSLVADNNIKQWYYGHFHSTNESEVDGIKFRLLNCIEYRFDMEEIK